MSLPQHRVPHNSHNHNSYNSNSNRNMTTQRGNGTNSFFGSREHRAEEASRNMLENDNDDKWDQLGESVSLLKTLTSEINNEVRSQNNYLDGMGLSFGSANTMFKTTIGKLTNMMQAGGANHMWLMALFIVLVFIIIYFMMK